MADGPQFLDSEFQQIAMGDQSHAAAVDALRGARDKSFVMLIEDEEDKFTLFAGMPNSQEGHSVFRMGQRLHQVASYFAQMAANLNLSYMANLLAQSGEEDAADDE